MSKKETETAVLVAIDAIAHQARIPVGAFVQDFNDAAIAAHQSGDTEVAAALSQMAKAAQAMQHVGDVDLEVDARGFEVSARRNDRTGDRSEPGEDGQSVIDPNVVVRRCTPEVRACLHRVTEPGRSHIQRFGKTQGKPLVLNVHAIRSARNDSLVMHMNDADIPPVSIRRTTTT